MADTAELLKRSHAGDKEARDRLVMENAGLVWSIVRRFIGRGPEPDDLFQIGNIGLIKAIDHFDTELGVRFSTYAVPMITGEIRRFLRDDGMIKVSRPLKELAGKVGAAREKLEADLGREPTVEELARSVGASREEVAASMIIKMRYFENMTQTVIAGRLGISQVQVSRLEKKILREMRERLTS